MHSFPTLPYRLWYDSHIPFRSNLVLLFHFIQWLSALNTNYLFSPLRPFVLSTDTICIGIFLPPSWHLLFKVTPNQERVVVAIATDNWTILPLVNKYLLELEKEDTWRWRLPVGLLNNVQYKVADNVLIFLVNFVKAYAYTWSEIYNSLHFVKSRCLQREQSLEIFLNFCQENVSSQVYKQLRYK